MSIDVRTPRMRPSGPRIPAVFPSSLRLAALEVAKGEEERGLRRPGLKSMETAGKEEGVADEVIIEMIVYQLPQLARDVGSRGRHGIG